MYTKHQQRLLRAVENFAPEAGYTVESEPYETAAGGVWLRLTLHGNLDQAFMTFGPKGGVVASSGFCTDFHTPTKQTAKRQARLLVWHLRSSAMIRSAGNED